MFYRVVFLIAGTMLFFNSYGENLQSPNAGEPIISVVAPGIWRLQFGEPEKFTPLTFRELDIAQEGLQKLGDADTPPFDLDAIWCSVTDSRTVVYIPCDEPSDEIYGFGLDPACYKQKGFRKELTVAAAPVIQTGASHGPVCGYCAGADGACGASYW